ncbi:MAG: C1 family peptidase [Rhodocyclaceae bacterium]|nr:C1 family peptidase [Rhodocyclaceae bacterium]
MAPKQTVVRKYDARPDTIDFRDRLYEATLVEVPLRRDLDEYLKAGVPVLNQRSEGACTGFGLATVAHYLLRTRRVVPDLNPVSPRMFYEMARRYDEWPGTAYSGSSARGAMKGWHKHGVCGEADWPYTPAQSGGILDRQRALAAQQRPLGAYLRVNHRDIVALHAALSEVGILYATASVHAGWERVGRGGAISRNGADGTPHPLLGGHAFAIVAYDRHGLWLQNSWGKSWGKGGFARLSYDDWLENGTDVWVARLGAPIELVSAQSGARLHAAGVRNPRAYASADLRPHIISIGNDGLLTDKGEYGNSAEEVKAIFASDFQSITKDWQQKRLLLYAHGGLVSEDEIVERIVRERPRLLANWIYPVYFVWHTGFGDALRYFLEDLMRKRRPEGLLEAAKEFLFERIDDGLEVLARHFGGKLLWEEVKNNALLSTVEQQGGARLAAQCIQALCQSDAKVEVHALAHSAGGIFHALLMQYLTTQDEIASGPLKGQGGLGIPVRTCTLWAPACRIDLFKQTYLPAIESGRIGRFALYTLDDKHERDDNCANIYHKSLLYLVSNAGEDPEVPGPGQPECGPLLGMQKFVRQDAALASLFSSKADWVIAPNQKPKDSVDASEATRHDNIDDDEITINATLRRILGQAPVELPDGIGRSRVATRELRKRLA